MTPQQPNGATVHIRPTWVLTPLESVGPLRFGMTGDEAAAVLRECRVFRRFQAEPNCPEVVGIELGFHPGEPALYEYFDKSGRLFCIAADAVRGPQVTLDGVPLTGGNPADLENWLFDLPESIGGVRYGPRANPGIDELGLVLRVQNTGTELLTRPVLVGRDWAERCTDDWEGAIPECEFIGTVFPDQRYPEKDRGVWPAARDTPHWGRWSPPF